jgi:hypothetical protein
MGRQAKGVRLVRLADKQYLSAMVAFEAGSAAVDEDMLPPADGDAGQSPVLMTLPEDLLIEEELLEVTSGDTHNVPAVDDEA